MRVIIEPNYEEMSRWAAEYVAGKINAANPAIIVLCGIISSITLT